MLKPLNCIGDIGGIPSGSPPFPGVNILSLNPPCGPTAKSRIEGGTPSSSTKKFKAYFVKDRAIKAYLKKLHHPKSLSY